MLIVKLVQIKLIIQIYSNGSSNNLNARINNNLGNYANNISNTNLINNSSITEYLCCYYVADYSIDPEIIIARLKKKLPDYMIPLNYIWLDKLILNDNGKVYFSQLPKPSFHQDNGHINQKLNHEHMINKK